MKAKEIRALSANEIKVKIADTREELMNFVSSR